MALARATVVFSVILVYTLASTHATADGPSSATAGIHTAPAETQAVTCLPLAALVVLYDVAKGQVPLSSRSTIRDYLLANGVTLIENTDDTLESSDLAGVDLLWFTDMTQPFSGITYLTVIDWLQAGGRAIFEGDNALAINQFDSILEDVLQPTGLAWPTSATAGNTTNIFSHVTTTGVNTIWLPNPDAGLASGPFTDLFHDSAGDDLCGFEESGNRRIVVVTEDIFLDDVIGQADNFRFAKNVFNWMAAGIETGTQEIAVAPATVIDQVLVGDTSGFNLVIRNVGGCDLDVTPSLFGTPLLVGPTLFEDNFEDGNFNGWVDAGGTGTKSVTNSTAADSTVFSYREFGSSLGHSDGIYATTDTIQPLRINFWVRSASSSLAEGYVVLEDSGGRDIVWFLMGATGTMNCNPAQGGDSSYPYTPNTWYFITFANLDWTAKTFDYYVNGTLVAGGVGFRNPGLVNDVDKIELYNFHTGGQAWWDEISMWSNDGIDWLTAALGPVTIPPLDSLVIPFTIDATQLTAGTYDATICLESNDPQTPTLKISVTVQVDTPTGIDDDTPRDAKTRLHANYPNPFNPSTTIRYELEEAALVRVAIYDVSGRLVRVLVNQRQQPGRHQVRWDGVSSRGREVVSGVYLYRLRAGAFGQTRKLVFLK